ncbi:cytidylyltransferase domain-containing protein [Flavobacterium sp. ZS1P14]|uniref:acylneuraminate cytidylyltransferase family protein n=1 Tax=Flavobacterium sp. ZS1P14 TaxID=3401729 RepID=UPI003AAEE22D
MRVLGLIPARGGSKGIPGKNIKYLGGKPLIGYTSEIALQSHYLSEVILSSDDDSIIAIAKELGISVPFVRPDALAQDATPSIDVILHALEWYQAHTVLFDAVCLLQVTSPFRTVEFLNAAIEKFIKSDCDSLISVRQIPHEYNPHWAFEVNAEGNLKIATGEEQIISRRQELPVSYHRDGSIYITKTGVLLHDHSLYGKTTAFIESDSESYVNIDTVADWDIAEEMIRKNKK